VGNPMNLLGSFPTAFPQNFLTSLASNQLFRLCYRYRWLIIASTFCALALAGAWSFSQTPIYESSSELLFETQSNIGAANSKTNPIFQSLSESQLETHIKSLQDPQHIKESADKIYRSNSPSYQSFRSKMQGTTGAQKSWKTSLRWYLQKLERKLPKWAPFSFSQFLEPHPTVRSENISQNLPEEQIFTWLKTHVLVSRAIPTSSVTITAQAVTPSFASEMANTVATVYVEKFSQATTQTGSTYSSWKKAEELKVELTSTKKTLEEAKAKLASFLIEYPQAKLINEAETSQNQPAPIDAELTLLTNDVKQQEARYTNLLKEMEPQTESATTISDKVSITRPAFPVNTPIGSHPILTILLGFPVGLGGGIGLAAILEGFARKKRYLQQPADLKKISPELPFLGWLSDSGSMEQENRHSSPTISKTKEFLFEFLEQCTDGEKDPSSPKIPHHWLITSPTIHEGKTFLAQNMVKLLTEQTARPVLLIDANFSHPSLHTIVPLHRPNHPTNGLSDFLFNSAEINTIIQDTKIPNLQVVSVGQWAALPPEEFPSDRFPQLLQWCKTAQYHVIIIGPPVLLTDEISMFASHVEETMVIVRPGTTSRKDMKLAIKKLKIHGAKISGIVFYQLPSEEKLADTQLTIPPHVQSLPPSILEKENPSHQRMDLLDTHYSPVPQGGIEEKREISHLTYFDSQAENRRLKGQLLDRDHDHRVHWKGGPYNAEFKAQVALEALKEQQTVDELAKHYQIHPALISQWRRQIQRGAKTLFDTRGENVEEGNNPAHMELYAEIGRLKMEVDSLKKLPQFLTPKQK